MKSTTVDIRRHSMAEKIAKKVTDLVGHTPLLELSNIEKKYGLKARVLAKLEKGIVRRNFLRVLDESPAVFRVEHRQILGDLLRVLVFNQSGGKPCARVFRLR